MKKENLVMTKGNDDKGVTKYIVEGHVNSKNSHAFKYILENAIRYGETNIVLNMADVGFLGSDGIRTILKTYKDAEKAGGTFRIEYPSQNVRNALEIMALTDILI